MTQTTLVLVCKRPALGMGKQRLANKLGQATTLKIAEALLACAVEDVLTWPSQVVIAPAEANDREWATHLFNQTDTQQSYTDLMVLPQTSGNLGQRINVLDSTLRASGFNQLIYTGSDAPDIQLTDYTGVRDTLVHIDTVFKPTIDGGVSIMASRKPWPDLTNLPWSSSQLRKSLFLICKQSGHSIAERPIGFDVDEIEDLSYLLKKLVHDQRPARRALYQLAQQIIQ